MIILLYQSARSPQGADIISSPMFVDGDYGLLTDVQQLEGDTMDTLVTEIERQLRQIQKAKEASNNQDDSASAMPTRSKL